jgi:hypothetical protein
MSFEPKKSPPHRSRRGRQTKHRTLRASDFFGLNAPTASQKGLAEDRKSRATAEESIVSRQIFVGMMCETALGPLMTCGICHRRPFDLGAGFVTLDPSYDTAKDLVVGRVVCGACAAEHGTDEERLAELFEEHSVELPWSYGGSRYIAFVGRPFDVNVEVVKGGRR